MDQKSTQVLAVSAGPDLRGSQTCGIIAFSLGKVMIWAMPGSRGSAQNSAKVYKNHQKSANFQEIMVISGGNSIDVA